MFHSHEKIYNPNAFGDYTNQTQSKSSSLGNSPVPPEAGWSWGCVSSVDSRGRTIFVADAHRDGNQRFIVRVDEKLTAFMELESAIRPCGELA
jgi:hypothetical protein